jgi:hypothetical protein
MLSALMNQASDLLQQTRDRLNASALGLPASADSPTDVKNPAKEVPALEKSDGGSRFDRFDRDATTLRLSGRARLQAFGQNQGAAGTDQSNNNGIGLDNLGQAVSGAIAELRNQLKETFSALGLDSSSAAAAADAARDAVAGATRSESFQFQMSQVSAQETSAQQSDGDFYYGASLVAEQLEVSYDSETGQFQASVVRVSISVEIGTGDFVGDVGAGTLLNNSGDEIDLETLLGGSFFNGLELVEGEKEKALIQSQAESQAESNGTERLEEARVSPLILISAPDDEAAATSGDSLKSFRVDLLLHIARPNLPTEQTAVNSREKLAVETPLELLEPIDISV